MRRTPTWDELNAASGFYEAQFWLEVYNEFVRRFTAEFNGEWAPELFAANDRPPIGKADWDALCCFAVRTQIDSLVERQLNLTSDRIVGRMMVMVEKVVKILEDEGRRI